MLSGMFAPHVVAGGGGGGGPYLDELATLPRAVLSLRRMISTATVAVRIRRSSDNAEQDFGFDGDAFDDAAVLAFTGTGPGDAGFVTKFYDQTGNGEDMVQATTGKQPRVVNGGVYLGHAFIDSGASAFMSIASLTLGTPQVGMYFKGRAPLSTSGVRVFAEMTTVASSNSGTFLIYNNAGAWLVDSYNSASVNRAKQYASDTTSGQFTYLLDRSVVGAGEILAYKDGALRGSTDAATTEQTGNYATNDFYFGSRAGTGLYCSVEVETLVIYNADTSAIRASIEAIVA